MTGPTYFDRLTGEDTRTVEELCRPLSAKVLPLIAMIGVISLVTPILSAKVLPLVAPILSAKVLPLVTLILSAKVLPLVAMIDVSNILSEGEAMANQRKQGRSGKSKPAKVK